MEIWVGYTVGAGAVGYFLGMMQQTWINWLNNKTAALERMTIFDKALSGGNPVDLYNLRMADAVSKSPETIKAATDKELAKSTPEEEIQEPWANDPVYGHCEVSMDPDQGVVHIFDPLALDGPDTWTEGITSFMAKFSGEVYTYDEAPSQE